MNVVDDRLAGRFRTALGRSSKDRCARFRKLYCHLEDGRATQRALERLAVRPDPHEAPVG